MSINYVRYTRSRPVTILHDEHSGDPTRVLLFDPVLEEHSSELLGDRFRRIDIAFRDVDAVFFRGSTQWALQPDNDLRELIERDSIVRKLTKGSMVGVLHVADPSAKDARLQIEFLRSGISTVLDQMDWYQLLQQTEFRGFLKKAEALLVDGHYALPSGVHTKSYLSIRRLLSDPTTVMRLADWFLTDLGDLQGILVDQTAMLPLAFALQGLAARIHSLLPLIQVLDEYPADVKTMADALQALGEEAGIPRRLLFLLSVTNSGGLVRFFSAAASPSSVLRILFSTTTASAESSEPQALVRIPIEQYIVSPQGECDLCRAQIPLYRINAQSFEPEQASPHHLLKATITHLAKHSRFWGIADEMDAVKLHYDDEHHRHHAVYLDIPRLLAHDDFRKDCLRVLRGLRVASEQGLTPDLVLIPYHSSSQVVSDLVREAFPDTQIEILPQGTIRIPPALGPRIAAKQYILVADDAVITTKTMTDLKLQIYDICKKYERSPHIDFFAVVARPVGSQNLRWLSNRLRDSIGSHLHFAYRVFLPYPDPHHCPLCDERNMLTRYRLHLSEQAKTYSQQRLRDLRGSVDEPLYGASSKRRVVNSFMATNADGSTRNARRRTIFAATQAAALTLIDEIEVKEEEGEIWRVDVSDIVSKYYDPEILGGFFRSIGLRFLSWPSNPQKIAGQLYDFPVSEASTEVLAEMGWAAALGRLPAHPILEHLRRTGDEPSIVIMRDLIELNINAGQDRQVLSEVIVRANIAEKSPRDRALGA